MILRKDIPPRDLVLLTYMLAGEPVIDPEALSPSERSPVMDFLYDEFEMSEENGRQRYEQSILFGNGWELRLSFRDVRVTLAEPLFPPPGSITSSLPALAVAQSV